MYCVYEVLFHFEIGCDVTDGGGVILVQRSIQGRTAEMGRKINLV